jgi:predicted nucleotidyltransferase
MKKSTDRHINSFINQYLEVIRQIYNPSALWLFGSRISGVPKEESDIDLIMVSEKFRGRKFIYRMGDFLKAVDFPKHIDALCYTPEEFKEKSKTIGIVQEAIKSGEKII